MKLADSFLSADGTFVRNDQQTMEDIRMLAKACVDQKGPIFERASKEGTYGSNNGEEAKTRGRMLVSDQGVTIAVPL